MKWKAIIFILIPLVIILAFIFAMLNVYKMLNNNIAIKNTELCLKMEEVNLQHPGLYNTCGCWENSIKYSVGEKAKQIFINLSKKIGGCSLNE